MTDNEIIKVFECCSKPVSENCKECPLYSVDCLEIDIEKFALDLINRQQAEIERLQNTLDDVLDRQLKLEWFKMTNYKRVNNMSIEEMAEFLCDNFDCAICPAYDQEYCASGNLKICSKAMKKYLESEATE